MWSVQTGTVTTFTANNKARQGLPGPEGTAVSVTGMVSICSVIPLRHSHRIYQCYPLVDRIDSNSCSNVDYHKGNRMLECMHLRMFLENDATTANQRQNIRCITQYFNQLTIDTVGTYILKPPKNI